MFTEYIFHFKTQAHLKPSWLIFLYFVCLLWNYLRKVTFWQLCFDVATTSQYSSFITIYQWTEGALIYTFYVTLDHPRKFLRTTGSGNENHHCSAKSIAIRQETLHAGLNKWKRWITLWYVINVHICWKSLRLRLHSWIISSKSWNILQIVTHPR